MARIILLLIVFLSNITLLLRAQQVSLLFAGDAMQHQSQLNNALRNGNYDYSSYFQYFKDEISTADLAIVNLEGTSGGKPYKGYPMFSFPEAFPAALKEAGFDVFLTANNHALDRFSKGLIRTIDVLDSLQVYHTGSFKDSLDRADNYPLIIEKNNIRIALLNYTYDTNGIKVSPPCIINYIDKDQIREDIQKARKVNPDVIIANMHWGLEYKLLPSPEQKALTRFLADEGVDIIVGSHPHVVQAIEIFSDSIGKNHIVVYSLGNLVSAMATTNTVGGQFVKIILKKEGETVDFESCQNLLFYVHKKKGKGKIDFTLIPVSWAEKSQDDLSKTPIIDLDSASYKQMTRFAKNARDIFAKYNRGVREYFKE